MLAGQLTTTTTGRVFVVRWVGGVNITVRKQSNSNSVELRFWLSLVLTIFYWFISCFRAITYSMRKKGNKHKTIYLRLPFKIKAMADQK